MCIHPAGLYEYSRGGSGQGRSISWTAANMPLAIGYAGGPAIAFIYDSEHNRIQQGGGWNGSSYDRVTTYVTDPVSGAIFELYTSNSGSLRIARDYIVADGKQVAVQMTSTLSGSGTSIMLYQHQDALGSVIAVSDDTGLVREVDAYDPWGKRRFIDGRDDPANALSSVTPRGYTTQEMLPDVGLIHMNGRIYDPFVGRFLSADPTVEAQYNPQNWNRYSYVGNNPLRFTDPTGYCFLGCFYNNPIFRTIAAIAVAVTGQEYVLPELLGINGVSAAVISGSAAGAVQSESLQGALLGGASAAAFFGVGEVKGALGIANHSIASVALHGVVGGLVSVAGGGKFQSGFLAAGFADLAGPDPVGPGAPTEQLAANAAQAAIAGGIGSILGGGKFANGALTGAFGYLYNDLKHEKLPNGEEVTEGVNDTVGPLDFITGLASAVRYGIAKIGVFFGTEGIGEATIALEAPASGTVQAWSGTITSGAVPDGGMTAFRVWGGESAQAGAWLSPIAPESSGAARSLLSLPPGNSAELISRVQIPGGTQIQFGNAAAAFGQTGGGVQIQLLQRIPLTNFGTGARLPH